MALSILPEPPLPSISPEPALFYEKKLTLDRKDLTTYLNSIWQAHFSETPRVNVVTIAYAYPWKGRLGLIRLSDDQCFTFIGINALLQLPEVPEAVLITTIAHEMVHYAHGFGSPLPRPYEHPHANNVVDRELSRRHLDAELKSCNEWIDNNWYSFYDKHRATNWASLPQVKRPGYKKRHPGQ